MEAQAWTAIALLAPTLIGTIFYLGNRIDSLGARLDSRIDGLDSHIDGLSGSIDGRDSRIDGLSGRIDGLDSRIDGLSGRIDGLDSRMGFPDGSTPFPGTLAASVLTSRNKADSSRPKSTSSRSS